MIRKFCPGVVRFDGMLVTRPTERRVIDGRSKVRFRLVRLTTMKRDNMQTTDEERRRWRREHVDRFLDEIGLDRGRLAESAQTCLNEWARQVKLVQDQPSSNFGNAVMQLCKVVESELAGGLGSIQALAFLREGTLGQKAKNLEATRLDESTKQRLTSRGTKPGFVTSSLPTLLLSLAHLRSNTDAAHGNAQIRSASAQDEALARRLAGKILQGIVAHPKGPK